MKIRLSQAILCFIVLLICLSGCGKKNAAPATQTTKATPTVSPNQPKELSIPYTEPGTVLFGSSHISNGIFFVPVITTSEISTIKTKGVFVNLNSFTSMGTVDLGEKTGNTVVVGVDGPLWIMMLEYINQDGEKMHTLWAVDVDKRKDIWKLEYPALPSLRHAYLYQGKIYDATAEKVYVINAKDGKPIYEMPIPISDDVIFAGRDNIIYALTPDACWAYQADSTKPLWKRPMPGKFRKLGPFSKTILLATESTIIIGGPAEGRDAWQKNSIIWGLNRSTGAVKWEYPRPGTWVTYLSSVMDKDRLYTGFAVDTLGNSEIDCIDTLEGVNLWTSPAFPDIVQTLASYSVIKMLASLRRDYKVDPETGVKKVTILSPDTGKVKSNYDVAPYIPKDSTISVCQVPGGIIMLNFDAQNKKINIKMVKF
jgi:outer membrane protein assembly factor BamB